MFGYAGNLLRINLSKDRVDLDGLTDDMARKYIGGRGLGTKILFEELKPGIDPLGPSNKLLFMIGPIVGTAVPGNSRWCVMAKSPLTGCLGEAHAAGFFAARMRFSGFDGIIFEGVADSPVYLWVHDGEAEIRDAGHLWGKTTHETEEAIKKEVKEPRASVASIGVGGENLVKFACVLSDLNRAAGRTGIGAVMGSKRLKAVAVHGSKKVPVANEEGLRMLARKLTDILLSDEGVQNLSKHGTPYGVPTLNEQGVLPTKNFQRGFFEGAEDISGETMTRTILKRTQTCFACPVSCIRVVEVKSGPYAGDFNDGPEYETVAALGSLCLNSNLESIAMANHLCNLHSLDTISTGNVIAFAMDCYEKGLITKEDTDGIDLTWGNHAAIVQLIEKIARRQRFGDVLAEGVRMAAEKIEKGAEAFAVETKGLEVPLHEPRGKKGVGLMYAVANRGAVHTDATHDTSWEGEKELPELKLTGNMDRLTIEGKPNLIAKMQDAIALQNSMIMCSFTGNPGFRPVSITDLMNILRHTTGWGLTIKEFLQIGERINNLGRAFNVREGIRRRDDTLPKRLMEPILDGAVKGQTISKTELDKMLDEYYELRGWSLETGVPTREKLLELDLTFAVRELEKLGML